MAELPQQTESSPGRRLTVHDLDVLIRRMDSLATFPQVAWRAMQLTGEVANAANEEARTIARGRSLELIGSDPALTARLLALACAERPGAGAGIARAADILGFDAVHSMVLSAKVCDDAGPAVGRANRIDLWKHSLAVALAAEMVARALGNDADPDEAYVCGLLHDLGKLVLAECMPKSYQRVLAAAGASGGDVQQHERKIIGVEHSVVGRRLAEHWRLPEAVRETAWLSSQPVEAIPQSVSAPTTVAAVALADALACELHIGSRADCPQPGSRERLAEHLGVSPEALADIRGRLENAVELRCQALSPGDAKDGHSDRDTMARANAELGRLAEHLRLRVADLGGQAEALAHVRQFAATLAPESAVGDVIKQAAEAMAAALDCEPSQTRPVVAYAAAPGETTALAVRLGGQGATQWRTFDAPAQRRQGIETPARTAAQAVAAVALDPADLAEWLDLAHYAHQGLVCGGQWIGGVFYPLDENRRPAAKGIVESVADTIALALAMVQIRSASVRIGEQLAGASGALAATQEALAEAKALSAVGEMAAGAAHELNTPLAVISGRAQLMRERASGQKEQKTWQLIADQAHCISDIISELMVFASPPPAEPTRFAVGDLLNAVVKDFSAGDEPQDAPSRVDILIAEDTPPVRADRGQIHTAVLELVTNAATAGSGRSGIRLEAEFDDVNEAVLLKVEDSGPGMDEKTADRAFTPFFSSQKAGRRRGMGLPRVKRLVENNGGRVWLKTQRGEGTTVYMLLPKA